MLRNPYSKLLQMPDIKNVLNKRLDILSDVLGFDRNRLLKWGFAQTVLSVIWNYQSGSGRDKYWLEIAKIFQKL
jgi:streptomycin 6-kinase